MISFAHDKFLCFEKEEEAENILLNSKPISAPFPRFFEKKYVGDNKFETWEEITKDRFVKQFQLWIDTEKVRLANLEKTIDIMRA